MRDVSPTEPPLHPLPTDAPAVSLPYDQVDDYEYNYDNEYGRDTSKNNHNNVQQDEKDNIENDLSTGYDKLKHLLQHEETTSEDNTIALPKTDDTHRPAGVPAVASVEDGSGNSGSSPAAALSLVIILSAYLL